MLKPECPHLVSHSNSPPPLPTGYEYGAAVGGDAGGWGNGFAGMDAMGAAYDMGAGGDAGFLTEAGGGTQSGSKGKKVYGEKVMLSVTVKQLQDAENGDSGESIKVDGITPGYVKIVGTVESVDRHATQLVYLVNDTTGVMKVVFYLEKDDGENANKFADCKEGTFVRVIGLARAQANEERNILVFSMSVITDYNEVTNHMLESIYCHNFATKGPPPNATSVAQKSCKSGRPPSPWLFCRLRSHSPPTHPPHTHTTHPSPTQTAQTTWAWAVQALAAARPSPQCWAAGARPCLWTWVTRRSRSPSWRPCEKSQPKTRPAPTSMESTPNYSRLALARPRPKSPHACRKWPRTATSTPPSTTITSPSSGECGGHASDLPFFHYHFKSAYPYSIIG